MPDPDASRPCIVGLGELLWDCFPDRRTPGGAPGNFAYHAAALGAEGVPCSRVGRDDLGAAMFQYLRDHGLPVDAVQLDAEHATGRVDIELDGTEPSYEFAADVAWDHLAGDEAARRLARRADVICFGTLAQRSPVSREAIHAILAAAGDDCLKVYDVNLRPPWFEAAWIERSLAIADLVKLNEAEVETLATLFSLPGDAAGFACALAGRFGPDTVCITRGGAGAALVRQGVLHEVPGRAVDVVDPVGAGDSFTAALVVALLRDASAADAVRFANAVGGLVASRPGAMPDVGDEYPRLVSRLLG